MEDLVVDRPVDPIAPGRSMAGRKRVLVTGGDGYIGNILVPHLMRAGFDVSVADAGFYRGAWLYNDGQDRAPLRTVDVRSVSVDDLRGFDVVVHLAELSNDPLCEHDESLTIGINHHGTVALAEACRSAGVRRFVYASSCSIYGAADEDMVCETSPMRPQTAYARCKALVERDVGALADMDFSPVFLRFATAFGASPRMRFDIVLNNLAGLAWTTGRISLSSDGTPWRPLVHVLDISEAVSQVVGAPREAVHNEIFNVGANKNNYRVSDLAQLAAVVFPGCSLEFGGKHGDNRSYRVSFDKIGRHLPNFRCEWTAEQGFRQLRALFEHIGLRSEDFGAAPYTRVRQLGHLLRTRQVDETLRWRSHAIL